jgi:hypothetical protein
MCGFVEIHHQQATRVLMMAVATAAPMRAGIGEAVMVGAAAVVGILGVGQEFEPLSSARCLGVFRGGCVTPLTLKPATAQGELCAPTRFQPGLDCRRSALGHLLPVTTHGSRKPLGA